LNIYGGQGYACLLSSMGADHTPALAARVSFADYESGLMNDRNLRLIKYLAKHQHTSPFEHQTASFVIDCPIYVARQIMRHRTFSYNEVSRRYTSEALDFHLPDELRAQAKSNLQCSTSEVVNRSDEFVELIERHQDLSLEMYNELIESGVAREQARAVLPQSLNTTFWMTGNLLNWSKFLKLRLDSHSQPETREVAEAIMIQLGKLWPISLSALLGDHVKTHQAEN